MLEHLGTVWIGCRLQSRRLGKAADVGLLLVGVGGVLDAEAWGAVASNALLWVTSLALYRSKEIYAVI